MPETQSSNNAERPVDSIRAELEAAKANAARLEKELGEHPETIKAIEDERAAQRAELTRAAGIDYAYDLPAMIAKKDDLVELIRSLSGLENTYAYVFDVWVKHNRDFLNFITANKDSKVKAKELADDIIEAIKEMLETSNTLHYQLGTSLATDLLEALGTTLRKIEYGE